MICAPALDKFFRKYGERDLMIIAVRLYDQCVVKRLSRDLLRQCNGPDRFYGRQAKSGDDDARGTLGPRKESILGSGPETHGPALGQGAREEE